MLSPKNLICPGRLVILLAGRHAGKKAIVLSSDTINDNKAVVLGFEKENSSTSKNMPQEEVSQKKNSSKCFIKTVDFNQFLLTRRILSDEDFWSKVKVNNLVAGSNKEELEAFASEIQNNSKHNNKADWLLKPSEF